MLPAEARQGFLAQEFRQGRGPYYKLRWRQGGRQRVLYLGRDPARAERVRALLEHLQRPLRLARQLARLLQETRKHLHKAKSLLESQAQTQGLHYHGYSARRTLSPQEGWGPRAADHTCFRFNGS